MNIKDYLLKFETEIFSLMTLCNVFINLFVTFQNNLLFYIFSKNCILLLFLTYRSPCGPPYQRPNVVETKYIVKKNGPMGTSNQANAAASFFAKAHQKLQLNNNGLHDLSLRNNGGQGCSPASSRRFQVSLIMMFSTRVLNT